MIDAAGVLLVIAGLLIVVACGQPLAARLRLPPSVLLAAVGVAIGGAPIALHLLSFTDPNSFSLNLFADLPITSVTFIYVFLPLLVFEAGFATDVRRTLDDAAPILLLAVMATIIATAVIGLSLWPLAGAPLVVCLLLGAVVATTDPAAVIAIFRDVGAPARLTRLVEGEALLNDAAAISLFVVLLGMILSGRQADIVGGFTEFVLSFVGGGIFGICIGRLLVFIMSQVGDDRLAEASLTLAFAYLAFIAAERLFHVSGVVSVLGCGLMVSAFGRARIAPANWAFLSELWEQVAFWARSLIFLLAAILVPRLLIDVTPHDAILLGVLIAAAFAARILSLFGLVPLVEWFGLSQPIDRAYKLAIIWGGLRGALTLVLALAVTENEALDPGIRRFVAILATGFVLFTLFINGTTLRWVISVLGLDRLSLRDQALRDRVLALSYAEIGEQVRAMAKEPALDKEMIARVAAPYEARTAAGVAAEPQLADRDRLAVALAALGNQERQIHQIFGERVSTITRKIIDQRRSAAGGALDALRRQYPEYTTGLETLLVRRSAMREELIRYRALNEDGLITREVYDHLRRTVELSRAAERRPRFDIGLDTNRLIERLDLVANLDALHREAIARLLHPRFAVPNERIVRKGDVGGSVFFIGSGAVEVILPHRRVQLGTGDFFGEMALLTGQPRTADIVAQTYCRLLELRKMDFDRFMANNPRAQAEITRVAETRVTHNQEDEARQAE